MKRLFSKRGILAVALVGFVGTAVLTVVMGWGGPTLAILWLQWLLLLLCLQIYRVLMPLHSQTIDEHARTRVLLMRQVQALFQLHQDIAPRVPLPPLGEYAATPDLLATLVALVRENRPQVIVELGSGSSTLVCGYALESVGQGQILSFDHEAEYAAATNASLAVHGLSNCATVHHAALRETQYGSESWRWYDLNPENLPPIEMLIVDGPPMTTGRLARYPALPILWPRLAPSAVIVVDDANRPDETEMVQRWMEEFPGLRLEVMAHEKGTVILRRINEGIVARHIS